MTRMPGWEPREFYDRQDEWSGALSEPIGRRERANATLVERYCGVEHRVLELGAGGGQASVATAELGFAVDAVELVPRLAANARSLARGSTEGTVTIIEGNFYFVELDRQYGAVTYWDGFGIGTDEQQQMLLRRIQEWLAQDGRALIEIFTPWYWASAAGQEVEIGTALRRYEFDFAESRMIDTWWQRASPEQRITQRLRCYAPIDLELLVQPVGLALDEVIAGGAYDYDARVYKEQVSLGQAMSYVAVLRHQITQ